jgi:ABC-type Fe3+-hydroxamate transport system substrate-binding protein
MDSSAFYRHFQAVAESVKDDFLRFLLKARRDRKTVAAYGAAAKGNTLINFAGVRQDLIAFVVDRNPHKQGRFLPGSRIPIVSEERLREMRPDYVVLLPWNLRDELVGQLAYVADWGGRFVTAVPSLQVHNL